MNRQELADLIYPDAKDISYYEEMYPERELPEGAVVTRFAPSPTGFVHIGALEQCIVATGLGNTSIADYNQYASNGDATVFAALYANNQQVKLPSIYSFTSPTQRADYAFRKLSDNVSIVDGWWQIARAMGEDDQFLTAPLRVVVTDGTLRVGIKSLSGNPSSNWVVIGSFSLKYLGPQTSVPVSMSSYGKATFSSSYDLDFAGSGIVPYRAESANDQWVLFKKIESLQVPRNTGVLLVADGAKTNVRVNVVNAATAVQGINLMQSSVQDIRLNGTGNYVLAQKAGDAQPKFYLADDGYVSEGGKAYLTLPSTARSLSISFDEFTMGVGLTPALTPEGEGVVFDLQGRPVVSGKPQRGIYVVNGKKHIFN